MRNILTRIVEEIREAIVPTLFFIIAFHIVALSARLMRLEYGVEPATVAIATVGALFVSKVILIVDKLPFVDLFRRRPLVYNILWKTGFYWSFALLFRFLEELIPLIGKHGGLAETLNALVEEIVWPHFWGLQLWLLVFLAQYCLASELIRALGAQKVKQLFFYSRDMYEDGLEIISPSESNR